jgi:hypothetical protein
MDKRAVRKAAKLKKEITGREYLSYSQVVALESGQYAKRYIEKQDYDSEPMQYGRTFDKVVDGLEKGSNVQEHAKMILSVFPKKHYRVEAETPNGIKLVSEIDMCDVRKHKIHENKTGVKWTQAMVDSSLQLDFYDYIWFLKYGKPAKSISLFWLETKKDDWGDTIPTGNFKIFETSRNTLSRLRTQKRLESCWDGIIRICADSTS